MKQPDIKIEVAGISDPIFNDNKPIGYRILINADGKEHWFLYSLPLSE